MKSLAERQAYRYAQKCIALGVEALDLNDVSNLGGIGRVNLAELPFDLSSTAIIPTSIRLAQAANGRGKAGLITDGGFGKRPGTGYA